MKGLFSAENVVWASLAGVTVGGLYFLWNYRFSISWGSMSATTTPPGRKRVLVFTLSHGPEIDLQAFCDHPDGPEVMCGRCLESEEMIHKQREEKT